MREPVGVGVVGFGLAGRIFHTAVVEATPGLALACVVQRSGDEAAKAYPRVKVARSVEEMLGDGGIELVVIATPSYSHYELAKECLVAQRNVVVDKPFTLASAEAADLIQTARERKLLVTAYQNRRWDGDFLTLRQVIASGELGGLVSYEAHYDRFRQQPRMAGREMPGKGSGTLFDLGPHVIDQALTLFGAPETIFASLRVEREAAAVDDAWDIFLEYAQPPKTVLLRATLTACAPGPRYVVHGTKGSFTKWGLDPQEDQLKAGMGFDSPGFGEDPETDWGELKICEGEGGPLKSPVSRRVRTLKGDYRGFYANVRDALLGKAELEVKPEQAWRTTRLIELARESSGQGRRLRFDVSELP